VGRSKYEYAAHIVKCSRNTCKGGNTASTCWKLDQYEDNHTHTNLHVKCNSDSLQCVTGSIGPLCGSCDVGYVFRGSTNNCGPCKSAKLVSYIAVGSFMLLGVVAFLVSLQMKTNQTSAVSMMIKNNRVVNLLRSFDSGSLKVLWVTYQIIASSSFTLGITVYSLYIYTCVKYIFNAFSHFPLALTPSFLLSLMEAFVLSTSIILQL
jgi:hypothetical protein